MDAPMSDHHVRIRPATERDFSAVIALLRNVSLPLDGVQEHFAHFLVAEAGSVIVGTVGLEFWGTAGLLRSLAVDPEFRSSGVGGALCRAVLDSAAAAGVGEVFLLTTTAASYFAHKGFVTVSRQTIPDRLLASREFRGACPATATLMRLALE
jgi:N-acetylglutamate synthase-like GNAT family acetyltransferase